MPPLPRRRVAPSGNSHRWYSWAVEVSASVAVSSSVKSTATNAVVFSYFIIKNSPLFAYKSGGHCDSIRRCEAIRRSYSVVCDRLIANRASRISRGVVGDLSYGVMLANCAKNVKDKNGEGQDQAILTYRVGPVHMKRRSMHGEGQALALRAPSGRRGFKPPPMVTLR